MTDDDVRALIATVPHWYHPIEVRPGIVTPGVNDAPAVLRRLDLPEDCRGLRVLDLGTRDGFFAFEMERRGAEVLAVDYMPRTGTGFDVAARLLGSRVTYLERNVYALDPAEIGTFDIVLFLGLLYHLPDPLGGLRLVRSLSRRRMHLETLVMDFGPGTEDLPMMRFFQGDSWAKDPTNYWGPNPRCVQDMLLETGFKVTRFTPGGDRAIFACETVIGAAGPSYLDLATGRRTPGGTQRSG